MDRDELLQVIDQARREEQASLDLRWEGLTMLPPEIGQLTALTELNLGGNKLTGLTMLDLYGNKRTALPPEIGQLIGLMVLDLSDNPLTMLPPHIWQLTGLTRLDLSGNQLAALPPEIGQLTALTRLDLARNRLATLPPEIGQLAELTRLDLSGNPLAALPPEIGQLTALTELNLDGNKLTALPPEIGQLTALTELNLGGNKLTALPPEIGQLTALTELNLGGNKLTALPPEIGQLFGLTALSLRNNPLTALPPEIGQLTGLTELDLSHNQLATLPPEIGQLAGLTRLNLSDNQLATLPPDIGQLAGLTRLNLSDNQLAALPPEIGQLTSLTELDLSGNQLTALPPEIKQLTNLKNLDLGYNPLPVPLEILVDTWNPSDFLAYYFEEQTRPLHELKLLVVGEGGVGKTSLVRRLVGEVFDPAEGKTEGIEVRRWPRQIGGEEVRANVWDFGGQEIMHATHQFFLTHRSLYLLVLDARQSERASRLDYWLKIVASFGGDSPVIVVVNKIDQHPLDLDRATLRRRYPQIIEFAETSCATGQGLGDLAAKIDRAIGGMAHVRDRMPLTWFCVKERVEGMPGSTLAYPEYEALCREEGIDGEADQKLLIGFLHALGAVLYFQDDPRLAGIGVLSPDWVTGAVYRIINDREVKAREGKMRYDDLSRLLDRQAYPREHYLFLIDLMRRFELLFELDSTTYLIPELLPRETPPLDWDETDNLRFRLDYDVLPGSIISRFLVRMHPYLEPDRWWRCGAVLAEGGCRARVQADLEGGRIHIAVAGTPHWRRELLGHIRSELRDIQRNLPGLRAKERVPLSDDPDHTVSYEDLLKRRARGERFYTPEGLDEPMDIGLLLDGVASPEQQRRDGIIFNIKEYVAGDKTTVGSISDSEEVAIGHGASARVDRRDDDR